MSAQHLIWTGAGIALTLAVTAGLADHRRANRHRIDGWGWMPWRGIQMAALFAALGLAILALHR